MANYPDLKLYAAGEWRQADGWPVINPADESVLGTVPHAKSRNTGQVCVSPTRFFVEDAIYDRFADALAAKANTPKIVNGQDPDNQKGPLANERRLAAMATLVDDAKAKGASVIAGGARIGNCGCYTPVTVLADVPGDARAMREDSLVAGVGATEPPRRDETASGAEYPMA